MTIDTRPFTWDRWTGYEVSSQGDKRFSALNARMPEGRTIEEIYQCDIKGYQPGGRDWRLGKGKLPLRTDIDLWEAYLGLWRLWVQQNFPLMRELYVLVRNHDEGCSLADRFATTPINQARALSILLNELCGFPQL